MLLIMDKSLQQEILLQHLHTNKIKFSMVITFWTGYNRIFNVRNKNNIFHITVSNNGNVFNHSTLPPGAYEIESLNNEMKRVSNEERYFTEPN